MADLFKNIADCLMSPVKEIPKCILTQCVWPFIKPHYEYWWCFDNNIQELRDGIRDLEGQIYDVTQKIEQARLRCEVVRPGVEEWLKASTEKLKEARKILLPDDNIPKACRLNSRYSMGKNAKETAEEIAKHLNYGKFDPISDPAPPPAMASPYHRPTMEFQSRKSIEKDIIDSLKESSVGMIGICGMGGIGKTTMAERIGKRVMEENLFDEVVTVTVSQKIEEFKIQNEIAELLGLKFDVETIPARARQLRTRLMDKKKKIIILDDVWERFEFENLGIPIESNFEGCKVLLTSRSTDTCKGVKNKKVFKLEILKEDEAWHLFKDKAGNCVEDLVLHPMAKAIVAEPIALVTVGLALQDETDKHIWTYSLSKLKEAKPTDLPKEIMTHVYLSLELSYEKLDNPLEKRFFLLCCLFPEDYNIRIEELIWYCMGLQMFDTMSIEEATNKTHTLVGKLKSRFLLMDGWDKHHVKMHDVIRDVAIYIGSKEENGFLKSLTSIKNSSDVDVNCNWMSVGISNERMEVPVLSLFPKLRLLMLQKSNSKWSSNELSDISFEGMKELNVLSFERASIRSLPPTLGSLENLQTLCLFDCEVENISVIGKLTSLKILNCRECAKITELPAEIGSLSGLRLLELSRCKLLQTIPFGVISSLHRLEELKMRESFSRWEAEENGKERGIASLTELGSLPNLSCLEIEIDDSTLSAQEICLSLNLVKYYIRIGSDKYYYNFEARDYEKVMILDLSSHIGAVGKWIEMQVRNSECLYLQGDGSAFCQGLENPNLTHMEIEELPKLNSASPMNSETLVCHHQKTCCHFVCNLKDISFCNLKSIHINRCDNLKSLFSVSAARGCLLQLEVLRIEDCESMEQVFWNEGTDDNTDDGCIEFPKLKKLILLYLPNLTAFCQGLENIIIKFPNLTHMEIGSLPKLNSLSPLNSETLVCHPHTTSSLHFVCNPKDISFCNLKSINIYGCDNLKSLFSVSAARRCLLELEGLRIEDCESMEQVFWNDGTDDNADDGCIEFPKLKQLTLHYLPNLTAFCQGLENIIIKFPNLTQMWINGLPKLNSLSPLNSETLVCHHHTTSCLHFVCNPKVEMGGLKVLELGRNNIKNIWCHQIRNNVFNNLETLYIYFTNGIRSLMSTSIAINLVTLKGLRIGYCKEMVDVIERDDDDDKQVVDTNYLFPNLKTLNIEDMDKLRSFWQWNHALELLLLEEVSIKHCPVMETFTLGSINTPNIRVIVVNHKKIDDQKDLNDVIRHIWTKN